MKNLQKETAQNCIEQFRTKLLDLTKRNPLISFKHSSRTNSRVHLRAIDPHINAFIEKIMEMEGSKIPLCPLPQLTNEEKEENHDNDHAFLIEHARRSGFNPSYERHKPSTSEQTKATFQTLLLPEDFQRTADKIYKRSQEYQNEKGVNILHLVFGFIEWYEADSSDERLISPLVALRVVLKRENIHGTDKYYLSADNDFPQHNQALSEKLFHSFGFRLPEPKREQHDNTENYLDTERYLNLVRKEICSKRPRWTVHSYMTLGQFPFDKLVMYNDLDAKNWDDITKGSLIKDILGGREDNRPITERFAKEYEIDSQEIRRKVPFTALEADASQYSAIYDVMNGQNMVIQGPPGTGKSQTIANIITSAISEGKRVLFIADKQAALQVVKSKLDEIDVGHFCLELHSDKARKSDVIDSLSKRMHLSATFSAQGQKELKDRLAALKMRRETLNEYAKCLNSPFGGAGETVHDIIWAYLRRKLEKRNIPRHLIDVTITANITAMSAVELENTRSQLSCFQDLAIPMMEAYPKLVDHPWFGMTNFEIPSVDFGQCVQAVEKAANSAEEGTKRTDALTCKGFDKGMSAIEVTHLCKALDELDVPTVEQLEHWGTALKAEGQALHELIKTAQHIADSAEDTNPISSYEEVEALTVFIELLLNLDISLVDKITTELMEIETIQIFDVMKEEKEKLQEQNEELSNTYFMESIPDLKTLRQAAKTLRDSFPLLPIWVQPNVKKAHQLYKNLRKTSVSTSRTEMASELSHLAKHSKQLTKFSTELAYTARFGSLFNNGIETDLTHIEKIISWSLSIRQKQKNYGERGYSLLTFLLCGDHDKIKQIKRKVGPTSLEKCRTLLSCAKENGNLPATVDTLIQCSEHVHALSRTLRKAATQKTVLCEDIIIIINQLRDVQHSLSCYPTTTINQNDQQHSQPSSPNTHQKVYLFFKKIKTSDIPEKILAHILCEATPEQLKTPTQLAAQALIKTFNTVEDELTSIRKKLRINNQEFFGKPFEHLPYFIIAQRLRKASKAAETIGSWINYNYERRLLVNDGFEELLWHWESAYTASLRVDQAFDLPLSEAFDLVYYRSLIKKAIENDNYLKKFLHLHPSNDRKRFQELDRQVAILQRQELVHQLLNKHHAPPGNRIGSRANWTEYALLELETSKQKKHLPLRKLLDQAGKAIQALKPCFMMSPLSVAQYLKAEKLEFDLLVIDEASQMQPEEALGALIRSKQAVIVGDRMQLPPTNFFQPSKDEDADDDSIIDTKFESILSLASSAFQPTRRLRVHYRSRHESLIAFSNQRFYDNALITFPSPGDAKGSQGVSLVQVDGTYQGQTNLDEAKAICKAVAEHVHNFPERSLGIGTINKKQSELIEDEIRLLRSKDKAVDAFYRQEKWGDRLEPFFIKNIETIQGDERDTIFVSTVFGPTATRLKPSQNFGAINKAAGHRRLNVLFTRARQQLVVYTSLQPTDIINDANLLKGTQVLKDYLTFAKTGSLHTGIETDREPDSNFEIFVRDRLRQAGYEVVTQVGVAGFFIDLAIRHPRIPGTFLVGIECDGATYHSSRSARDRDILRQQVLEGLGWNIYRIWSTDWFRNPEAETEKLHLAIKKLEEESQTPTIPPEPLPQEDLLSQQEVGDSDQTQQQSMFL